MLLEERPLLLVSGIGNHLLSNLVLLAHTEGDLFTSDFSRDVERGEWFASVSGEPEIKTTVPCCCKVLSDEL